MTFWLTSMCSPICCNDLGRVHSGWREALDFHKYRRNMYPKSTEFTHLPSQSSLLHRFGCLVRSVAFILPRMLSETFLRGLIGPSRQFGSGSIYHPHLYAIAIGAVLPVPFWLWQRRYPESWVKYVSTPVILNGVGAIPPATGINYSSWFLVGFIFQYLIRKRNFAWWSKFNYVTSAALDSGTVVALMLIFFTLQVSPG